MDHRRRPSALLLRTLATPLLAVALCAQADEDSLPAVSAAALDFMQQAGAAAPASGRTTLYIGTVKTALLPHSITLWVDDAKAAHYDYSLAEGAALQQGARQALSLPMSAGAHRLRAEIFAVAADAPAYSSRTHVLTDWPLTATGNADAAQLDFTQAGALSKPALELHPVDAAAQEHMQTALADFLAAEPRGFDAQVLRQHAGMQTSAPMAGAGPTPGEDYNQALLAIQQDHEVEGLSILSRLGSGGASDDATRWLQDRANLTRGMLLLGKGSNDAAIQAFRAVRSPGPFASRALLGYGWACALPPHATVRPPSFALPGTEDGIAELRRQMPFRRADAVATKERADDLKRALIPWTELIGRDPLDPAVQEGMLVVPYTMTHLGAQMQAADYYGRAVTALERANGFLDAARASISGGMVGAITQYLDRDGNGWRWQFADVASDRRWWLDAGQETGGLAYGSYLMEDDGFVLALQNYSDAHILESRLRARSDELRAIGESRLAQQGEALRVRTGALAAKAAQDMIAQGLAVIERRRAQTAQYLAEAHLALARFNDPGVRVSAK